MASRLKLQSFLEEIMNNKNVYFQPPEAVKMKYPAIVYGLDDISLVHATNKVHFNTKRYFITLIDANPDSIFVEKICSIPTCRFLNHFTSDGLNHWRFSINY